MLRKLWWVAVVSCGFARAASDPQALLILNQSAPQIFAGYKLLNADKRPAPAKIRSDKTEVWPLANVVQFQNPRIDGNNQLKFEVKISSAIHLSGQDVLSTRASIQPNKEGKWENNIFVVYYDKDEKLTYAPVTGFASSRTRPNLIKLTIPASNAANWHEMTPGGQLPPTAVLGLPDPQAVRVFAFDDLSHWPNLRAELKGAGHGPVFGSVLQPADCMMGLRTPAIKIRGGDGKFKHELLIKTEEPVIDDCDRNFVEGNQGAVIVRRENLLTPLGLFTGHVTATNSPEVKQFLEQGAKDDSYVYVSASGRPREFDPVKTPEFDLLYTGTFFPEIQLQQNDPEIEQ